MNKLSYILILSLFFAFTSASAEMSSDSIANIFQRLETLEKKSRELYGDNEVLKHQLDQLKKNQKKGFLDIDERIEDLSASKTNNKVGKVVDKKKDEKVKIVDYSVGKKAASADVVSKKEEKPATPAADATEAKKPPLVKEAEKPKEAVDDKKDSEKAVEKTDEEKKESSSSKKIRAASAYEKETYQIAFNLMKTSPSAATTAFKEYIKMQPDSPLAANSQYWIAEIMYSHNNYKGAVQEFVKVLQKYKYSDKAPDAAIKLGYSFYALKNWTFARRTFDDVLKYFPENKNAVNLATNRLEKMTAAGH